MPSVFEEIAAKLSVASIHHDVLRHEPVFTSEEAARIRGTALGSGAKALVCRVDAEFQMFVLPADRKLDSKLVRKSLGNRSLRFASREEVEQLTALQPGSIPPFGSLFGLKTYCDVALADHPQINFNAGDHSISIRMSYEDYLRVEQPTIGSYSTASIG